MTSLPQRKKTAGEIAQLRESLGVPSFAASEAAESTSPPAVEAKVEAPALPASHAATTASGTTDFPPPLMVSLPLPKLIRSQTPKPGVVKVARGARSLKKSEQGPVEVVLVQPDAPSALPVKRHSAEEIEEMRRRESLERLQAPGPNPKLLPASRWCIAPGYGFALAAAAWLFIDHYPLLVSLGCAAAALIVAGWLLVSYPVSRHHAGFIAAVTLLIVTFAILHYFPHLKHAP